ncbi:MAG: hypothetical protein ABSA62_16065 [Methyloceanibacter sp.]
MSRARGLGGRPGLHGSTRNRADPVQPPPLGKAAAGFAPLEDATGRYVSVK